MIVFDLDGTLYQTHKTCMVVLKEMCDKYRLELGPEDENYLMYTTVASLLDKVAPDMPEFERIRFQHEYKWREIEVVSQTGELFDGAEEVLRRLRTKGHKLAICGMGSEEYIAAVLKRCSIRKYFDYVYPRQEGKTKSQVLMQLLCESGEQKADCVMVGDSITDLTAARENNIPFIGVSYGYGANDIKESIVANDTYELTGTLNQFSVFPVIYSNIQRIRPIVVGVNGVDTSGKTIFSDRFARYLEMLGHDVLLIHLDDFHNRRAIRMRDPSPRGYLDNAFNTELLGTLLSSIREGTVDIELALLDLDTDEYTNRKRFAAGRNTIVIVEGVLLYRPPIDQYFDYKIFLDIEFDEVLRRAEARDVPKYGPDFLEKYRNRYIPAQQLYLEEYSPKTDCHMLIDNNDYDNPVIRKAAFMRS